MAQEPLARSCSNNGRSNYWTCPGCYADLGDVGEKTITCDNCGNVVECSLDYEPVCHSRLVDSN